MCMYKKARLLNQLTDTKTNFAGYGFLKHLPKEFNGSPGSKTARRQKNGQ